MYRWYYLLSAHEPCSGYILIHEQDRSRKEFAFKEDALNYLAKCGEHIVGILPYRQTDISMESFAVVTEPIENKSGKSSMPLPEDSADAGSFSLRS